jgi:putative endonuclease
VSARHNRQAAERRGHAAENRAAWFLRAKGYRLLARRFRTAGGEIDLIVRRGRTVVFVEVKHRGTLEAAAQSITATGRARIAAAAAAWLARNGGGEINPRFDVVLMAPRRWPRHLHDAFDARGGA